MAKHPIDGEWIDPEGNIKWYRNNKLHRDDDEPAVLYADGGRAWYRFGQLDRSDGPAYCGGNGDIEWFVRGQLHRLDGPAVVWDDGTTEYWVEGCWIRDPLRYDDAVRRYKRFEARRRQKHGSSKIKQQEDSIRQA